MLRPPTSPFPPESIPEAKKIASRLVDAAVVYRRLTFTNGDRDLLLLRQIAVQGCITTVTGRENYPVQLFPTPQNPGVVQLATLRTLDSLVAKSSATRPLELLSLYRPMRSVDSREPHSRGYGIDIATFGGYRLDNRRPESCVRMTVALLDALPTTRRDYRIGLPKPPNSDQHGMEPPIPRNRNWPFFPAPRPNIIRLFRQIPVVMPQRNPDGSFVRDKRGPWLSPEIVAWANEEVAPLEDIHDARVRRAIVRARRRGANLWMLFPDAADHIHLDTISP